MARKASLVTLGSARHPFQCHVCQGQLFVERSVQLNTSGMEFLGIEWANRGATGLICETCGYVHLFMSDSIGMWEPDGGYPGPEPE